MTYTTTTSPASRSTGFRATPGLTFRFRRDDGQATAEYALVMLAAAGLAGSVLAWAVGTDAIGRLMNAVVESLISQVS